MDSPPCAEAAFPDNFFREVDGNPIPAVPSEPRIRMVSAAECSQSLKVLSLVNSKHSHDCAGIVPKASGMIPLSGARKYWPLWLLKTSFGIGSLKTSMITR